MIELWCCRLNSAVERKQKGGGGVGKQGDLNEGKKLAHLSFVYKWTPPPPLQLAPRLLLLLRIPLLLLPLLVPSLLLALIHRCFFPPRLFRRRWISLRDSLANGTLS
jgi:hypothetical protein